MTDRTLKDGANERSDALQRFTRRGILLGLGHAAVFGGLASRLYQLQVLDGAQIGTLATDNRTRQLVLILLFVGGQRAVEVGLEIWTQQRRLPQRPPP